MHCCLCSATDGSAALLQVLGCISAARKAMAECAAPWACVHVWGMADAPQRWRGKQRTGEAEAGGGGESHYAVLLLPDDCFCVFQALGQGDGD